MTSVTQKQMAAIVGLSTRQIRNLETDGMPVISEDGKKRYPLPSAVQWWRDREVERALEPFETTELQEERRRLVAAQADRQELELAERLRKLVPLDEVESLVRESLESVAASLRRCPRILAASWSDRLGVSEREAHALILEVVEDAKTVIREDDVTAPRSD